VRFSTPVLTISVPLASQLTSPHQIRLEIRREKYRADQALAAERTRLGGFARRTTTAVNHDTHQ
jgi:hypothetical protein